MSDHLHDEEQVEALKRWWNENGKSTLMAVVLAVGGTVGWQQYQGYTQQMAANASDLYAGMMGRLQSADSTEQAQALVLAERLREDFSGTQYAVFAALQLASIAIDEGDTAAAVQILRSAYADVESASPLGQMVALRLARALSANGEEAEALSLLEAGSAVYATAYLEARGDLHLAAGRDDEALAAYKEAQASILDQGRAPALLDAKINSLEVRTVAPAGADS